MAESNRFAAPRCPYCGRLMVESPRLVLPLEVVYDLAAHGVHPAWGKRFDCPTCGLSAFVLPRAEAQAN